MVQTRESRYISSSDGLQRQSEATAQIAQASAQGVARIQQGQQQYFEGIIQNNNNLSTLQQQLAQVELAGATSGARSSLQQLGQGIVQGLSTAKGEQDAQKAKLAALAKEQAKIAADNTKQKQLTQYQEALGDLTDSYASSNWKNGIEQYKTDAVEIIKNLPADADPEVKKLLIQQVHENSLGRARQVGEDLQKNVDELRAGKVDEARSTLMLDLSGIVTSIAGQSTDEQAKPLVDQAKERLRTFLDTDSGLSYGKKLSVISSALDSINTAYSKKYARYAERTAGLRDWNSYAAAYKELEAKEAAGILSYDDMRNQISALNFRYPGMEERIVQRGDKEKRDLVLQQTVEAQRKLSEEAGVRAISNYRFGNDTVKSLVAAAYSDPSFYNQLKNDPAYKDNPQFAEALKGADRLQDYFKQENQIVLAQADAATAFQKLDLSNLQTTTALNRAIAQKTASGQALSPTEQMAALYIEQIKQLNPTVASTLELGAQGKPIPQIDQQLVQETLKQEVAVTDNIKATIIQKINAQRDALYKEFTDLRNYGFIGQTPDAIRAYGSQAAPAIQKEFENINRLRQEAIQQQTTNQYGVQPNFNLSSSYATSVDGNGKIKVVPRSRVQLIRLPDSSSVVTPVLAGNSAPVTSHWKDPRPGGRLHAGVDFGASNGAKAVALVPGQVVYVGNDPSGYGTYVDLLGDNGVLYRYAHQAAQVKVGQRLNSGDVVSVSNGSGIGDPHLHFEVRPHPGFTNGKYDVSKNLGVQGTVEVLDHLRKLTANNSNVTTPRFNSAAYRTNPSLKVPSNSTLSNRGGAINGGVYQRAGGTAGGASNRITSQRPLGHSQAPYKVNVGLVNYDYGNDYGYAELAKDSSKRKAFVDTAKTLGVPTEWLVDIARQEAGSLNPYVDHDGNHYGLFGFGSDSLNDQSQYKKLRAGELDTAGQLKLYVSYLKENGWEKVKKQKGNAITIADLWAFTRYGWNARQKFWNTSNVDMKTEGSLTYRDELKLLGKWAGRSYSLPGSRSLRSSAIHEQESATCPTCAQLALSSTFVPHTHTG